MTNDRRRLRRWAPLAIATALLTVAVGGNLASTLDHQARAGQTVGWMLPLLDEVSSAIIWLALLPVIVRAFKALAPPRVPWAAVLPLHLGVAALVSLAHYGLTRLLRALVYFGLGEGRQVPLTWDGYVADLYKDILNYLLLGLIYWGAEALLTARAAPVASDTPVVLEVRDGAQVLYLPITELLWVEAAGNYVQLHATGGREILMRATLASLAQRLESAGFLRIHRSRLVKTSVVSAVENLPAGDATLLLSDGSRISASRRYRPVLAAALGNLAAI